MKSFLSAVAIALSLTSFAAVAAPIDTGTLVLNGTQFADARTGVISGSAVAGGAENVYISPLTATFTDSFGPIDLLLYCIDLGHFANSFGSSALYGEYTQAGALSSDPTQAELTRLGQLFTFKNKGANATEAAALQLAVWEIISEPNGGYSFSTGAFQTTGNTDVQNLALSYINGSANVADRVTLSIYDDAPLVNVAKGPRTNAVRPDYQNFLAVGAPNGGGNDVPEPSTIALGFAGLGMMLHMSRRAKKSKSVSTSMSAA